MADLGSLDADEGLARRRHRHWFDRLMMLSDGVFAIAITFLAADIANPIGWAGDWAGLWARLDPQLNAYSMSFLVISIYWLAHRRFMAMILTVDAPITIITLVALGLVALLPAGTRLIGAFAAFPVARIAYAGLVMAIGLSLAALWGYAALIAKVVAPEVNQRLRWFILLLIFVTPPFFLFLTLAIPEPFHDTTPVALLALFLIGWRMRRWTIARLGGKPFVG